MQFKDIIYEVKDEIFSTSKAFIFKAFNSSKAITHKFLICLAD